MTPKSSDEATGISLVIPLYNEEGTARELLESVLSQTRIPDRVVCVDAGSTDRTAEVIAPFCSRLPLTIVRADRLFPGAARNTGAQWVPHEWIAFTDGGCLLDSRWLERLERAASEAGADVAFGTYEPVCDTLFQRGAAVAFVSPHSSSGIRGPSVVSMLVRRSVFQESGGFPSYRASEDLILIERLFRSRSRITYVPDAVARWELPSGLGATFRRFVLYSQHNLLAGRARHWHLGLGRQYAAVTLVAAGLWVAGAAGWGIILLPMLWIARAAKSGWMKRGSFPFNTLSPLTVLAAGGILALIDIATAIGLLRWALRRSGSAGA